jgi:NADPH-dependent ferric siderophore reductase
MAELDQELHGAAVRAVLGFVDPGGMLALAHRTHEHLLAGDDAARPRRGHGLRRILLDAPAAVTRHGSSLGRRPERFYEK